MAKATDRGDLEGMNLMTGLTKVTGIVFVRIVVRTNRLVHTPPLFLLSRRNKRKK